MERFEQQPLPDVLIIDLGAAAIKCANDCDILWDEIESIADDYPDNIIIFKV